MERGTSPNSPNSLVSRILQVALGLFVTTSDLPPYPANHEYLSYDCSFDSDCRWASVGGTPDHWRIARGEPDSLLWLAATGTMQLPREPFVLIEQRGNPVDALMTDEIRCQRGSADLSFIYWAIGSADLEICLTDINGERFNCTGMLSSSVMPGKVFLKIPEIQKPFRVMIASNNLPGVLIIDDIRYDATTCREGIAVPVPPPSPATFTLPLTTEEISIEEVTVDLPNQTSSENSIVERKTAIPLPSSSTDVPFELMVLGNKTRPLFDRRTGTIIGESAKLLCDFNNEFACQWGAEAGRWAVIEKAALVLQGTAMLTSDPIRCQTGPGKLLFRYWSNGDIVLQVCILGHDKFRQITCPHLKMSSGVDSQLIECIDQGISTRHESRLAVFDLTKSITEPFTLNLVPHWEKGVKNRFLVIDEIAYIGECVHPDRVERPVTISTTVPPPSPSTTTEPIDIFTSEEMIITDEETIPTRVSVTRKTNMIWPTPRVITLPPIVKPLTKDPYPKKKPHPTRIISTTTRVPDYPRERTSRWSTTQKPPFRWVTPTMPTTEEPIHENYCDSLNCNFDDNACSYLNHGLTKKPWTLRNRGYGYPLTGGTDIRPTAANGQFVSTILDPGDIAILESPKMNATRSLNVLLFQYFRPSQMTTIRLCLGLPFYLVAHNSERADTRAAVALDNMRVAICDPRGFTPDYLDEFNEQQQPFADYEHGI
ncbi:hypothetical protein NECAME_04987 [Necator americanus]|uniref:MAM domain-containing protein n=1 Tax=Necator americanus TaxID=51031 RepID=W2SMS7_NECAM|nr:hypothetical protein NECAME_04987 [Necator americanus]ETN70166.1 hypothetical protein NECAME_04987 [Necator americanus]